MQPALAPAPHPSMQSSAQVSMGSRRVCHPDLYPALVCLFVFWDLRSYNHQPQIWRRSRGGTGLLTRQMLLPSPRNETTGLTDYTNILT